MWITQTYLGSVEPDADVFVYYLFMNYIPEQLDFTNKLQGMLETIGDVFGGKVSLLMPNPRYAGKIEAEVREIRPLWEAVYSNLPGLLISTVPLTEIKSHGNNCLIVPFKSMDMYGIITATNIIKTLADRSIEWKNKPVRPDREGFYQRLADSIELKPGIFGLSVDLRRLFNC